MIAFTLIFVSCFPMTADLVREILAVGNWATLPPGMRRRILREAGLTILGWVALIELFIRFTLGF